MTDLTDFLLARIADDERRARAANDRIPLIYNDAALRDKGIGIAQAGHIANWSPARVLAECETKRRIVERHRVTAPHYDEGNRLETRVLNWTMQLFALPYADHPDYDESWRQ